MGRRRNKVDKYRSDMTSIDVYAKDCLFVPVQMLVHSKIESKVKAHLEAHSEKQRLLIQELRRLDRSINVTPAFQKTHIRVQFNQPADMNLVSWLNPYPTFSTLVTIEHPECWGKGPFAGIFQRQSDYSDNWILKFPWNGPYNIEQLDATLTPDEQQDVQNMLQQVLTIHIEFGQWTAQFKQFASGEENKDAVHHACFFSNIVREWYKTLNSGSDIKAYVRRPQFDNYNQPMSAALQTALTMALNLHRSNLGRS